MYNNHIMLKEHVGCACYSLPVMFHASIVVRRENMVVISKTHTAHITGGMWKSETHHLRWEEGDNSNV